MRLIENPFQVGMPNLCADALLYLVRLRKMASVDDAEALRGEAEEVLRDLETRAAASGYSPDEIAAAKYAIVAFLDEIVLHSAWGVRAAWADRPLQLTMFNEFSAGEEFFNRLEALRGGQDPKRLDILEVYLLCLALGFRGKFADLQGMNKLRVLRENVGAELNRGRSGADALSTADSAGGGMPPLTRVFPVWTVAVACAAVVLLLYTVLSWKLRG